MRHFCIGNLIEEFEYVVLYSLKFSTTSSNYCLYDNYMKCVRNGSL